MLTESLSRVMLRMRLGFLRKMFITVREDSQDLTPMEIFCLEGIEAMERPTISQFARFTGISQSNATYRVNCLIRKGYVNRVPSDRDRREFHLELTEKFKGCGPAFEQSCRVLAKRIAHYMTREEVEKLTDVLDDSLDKWNALMETDELMKEQAAAHALAPHDKENL